jgi:CheY-like chemotaxis protein
MPQMNGVDLARALRADPAFAMLPLILLTSAGRKGDPQTDARALFDAYLVKPARASMLLDTIASVLSDKSAEQISAAASSLSAAAAAACRYTVDGAPLDVLVAEDNVVNQMVVKSMLEKLGCDVRIAANGAAAICEFDAKLPDLVLMDVSMPGMDGMQATAAIRARGEAGRIPIVGVTAHALREDRQKCIDAGMDDYLPKPVRLEALDAMIARWTIGDRIASAAAR